MNTSSAFSLGEMVYQMVTDGDTLLAACQSGVCRSTDNGATWRNLFDGDPHLRGIPATTVAVRDSLLIAGIQGAIVSSEDDGASWQVTMLPAPPPLTTDILFATSPDGLVLAATADDGVFISSDHGATWTAWNFGLLDTNINSMIMTPDQRVLVATESGIFSSDNGGKSWREMAFPMAEAPVLCLCVAAGRLFAGTESGKLWVADSAGMHWSSVPEWKSEQTEAIHAIQSIQDALYILTDHHLITLNPDDLTHRMQQVFADRQALGLAQSTERCFVIFADGSIRELRS